SGTATAEGPNGIELSIVDGSFKLDPNQTGAADLKVKLPADAQPGFYHVFVRFETDDGKLVSYAWIELRNPSKPKIDTSDNGGVHPEVYHDDGWKNFYFNRD